MDALDSGPFLDLVHTFQELAQFSRRLPVGRGAQMIDTFFQKPRNDEGHSLQLLVQVEEMVGDILLLLQRSQVFTLAQPPPPSCSLWNAKRLHPESGFLMLLS